MSFTILCSTVYTAGKTSSFLSHLALKLLLDNGSILGALCWRYVTFFCISLSSVIVATS